MAGALSQDDQLLGEKMNNYCSSSEDEYESCEEGEERGRVAEKPITLEKPDINEYNGTSTNTGPKGVIADWRRFKQLETEKREDQQRELVALQQKLSITCRSHLDDDKEKNEDDELMRELELLDDDFLKEYQQKRLEEMRMLFRDIPQYGSVIDLQTAEDFIDASEKAHPMTTVIVHLYENNSSACTAMNGCLECICKEYPSVKFCKILAHKAQLSSKFSENGVPALLVYRKGSLVGNLVALGDELGDDFFAEDVENLLNSNGLLPAKTVPGQILTTLQ